MQASAASSPGGEAISGEQTLELLLEASGLTKAQQEQALAQLALVPEEYRAEMMERLREQVALAKGSASLEEGLSLGFLPAWPPMQTLLLPLGQLEPCKERRPSCAAWRESGEALASEIEASLLAKQEECTGRYQSLAADFQAMVPEGHRDQVPLPAALEQGESYFQAARAWVEDWTAQNLASSEP